MLQQLTTGGNALNTKFNSSGNFGYPSNQGGIGAGSAQADLRHLGSQRVLVLVDGLRWVNEASASGVGGSVDLNTIPMATVERIEVLEDGASSIYGSDAISGVINIITRKDYRGFEVNAYAGKYGEGGDTRKAEITWGTGGDAFNAVVVLSHNKQEEISSSKYEISSTPKPFTPPSTGGSSGTPQGRFLVYSPNVVPGYCEDDNGFGFFLCNVTTLPNTDVGADGIPTFPSQFINWSNAQRFNFAPYNLILTPNERNSAFVSLNGDMSPKVSWYARAMYNTRESTNQAAPEPIFIGPDAGAGPVMGSIVIPANHPFNPFGFDLFGPRYNPDGTLQDLGTFSFAGRRPLEGGPRIFEQTVDTTYLSAGLKGALDNGYEWDINLISSKNDAEQTFYNGYNTFRVRNALGNPAVCLAMNDGCTPLNFFGGQGANGQGTITQAMLDYIRDTQNDASEQQLFVFSANITGDLTDMPAGMLSFAAGFEHRNYEGSFSPDALRIPNANNEWGSQDSAAAPTDGDYDVNELYGEIVMPLAEGFDLSAALRYSDYSNFGNVTNGKLGVRWEIAEGVLARATYAEGFRAPFIGELFGQGYFGPEVGDPCSGYAGSGNATLIANCQALGIPTTYEQINPQVTGITGGNQNLDPEKSESFTAGVVISPEWLRGNLRRLDFELTYYNHEITDAIQAPDPQEILNRCAFDGPSSPYCSAITRTAAGFIDTVEMRLQNIGSIETSGVDFKFNIADETDIGRLSAALQASYVIEYEEIDFFGNQTPRKVGVEVNDGAIPRVQANTQLGWGMGDFNVSWNVRYIDEVVENGNSTLDATVYNDLQLTWDRALSVDGLRLNLGVNNLFDEEPPACFSCSLNGYDASTYDLPDRFIYLQAVYTIK